MSLLFWFICDLIFSGLLEMLLELTHVFNSDRRLRVVAVACFAVIGFGGGLLTGAVAPAPLFDTGPFPGVSLVVVPGVLAAAMHLWGTVRRNTRDVSHLATWYGGATVGLGLAAGRLVVLAFPHSVGEL